MKEIKETLSNVKRGHMSVKVCPQCGSTDIISRTMTGYITQPSYTCNNCGFQSSIFPEVALDEIEKGEWKSKIKEGDP